MILLLLLLLPLILIYPRLISFEIYRGGGSMCQDGTLSAGQAWMPFCAAHLHDHSQNAAGTQGVCPGMMIYCGCGRLAVSCDQFR